MIWYMISYRDNIWYRMVWYHIITYHIKSCHMGTSCLGYTLSWVRVVLGTSCSGYELPWVRVVLGTSCLGYELSRSHCGRKNAFPSNSWGRGGIGASWANWICVWSIRRAFDSLCHWSTIWALTQKRRRLLLNVQYLGIWYRNENLTNSYKSRLITV